MNAVGLTPVTAAGHEPACCNVPMVHNSWTGERECADAYYTLVDDGLCRDGEGVPDLPDGLDAEHRALWRHWQDSRTPDEPADWGNPDV